MYGRVYARMKPEAKLPTYIFIITFCCIFLWLPIFMNYYIKMQADFLNPAKPMKISI